MTEPAVSSSFSNEIIQLIALTFSLLTNIALVSIRFIAKERQTSIKGLQSKVRKYKILESCLEKNLDELRAISLICEGSANSSKVFAPAADKATIHSFYDKTIYRIKAKADKALETTQKKLSSSPNNQPTDYPGSD